MNSEETLQELRQRKVIKVLQKGGKSRLVELLAGNIIKKAYFPRQLFRFQKEIEYLTHLTNCPFVPKLVNVDHDNFIIYMTFVGKPLKKTPHNQKRVRRQMKRLHHDWNLLRHKKGKPNYDIYIGNATIMNDTVHIIDFGSPHYKIIGPPV
jgi:predicted Ser/Thr protein kinase